MAAFKTFRVDLPIITLYADGVFITRNLTMSVTLFGASLMIKRGSRDLYGKAVSPKNPDKGTMIGSSVSLFNPIAS